MKQDMNSQLSIIEFCHFMPIQLNICRLLSSHSLAPLIRPTTTAFVRFSPTFSTSSPNYSSELKSERPDKTHNEPCYLSSLMAFPCQKDKSKLTRVAFQVFHNCISAFLSANPFLFPMNQQQLVSLPKMLSPALLFSLTLQGHPPRSCAEFLLLLFSTDITTELSITNLCLQKRSISSKN